jgi:hypothetical protein
MALFAEISGAESLGELGAGAENDFQVCKITRSKSAGAESCSEVRAEDAKGRVKSAKFVFFIFLEAFFVLRKFFDDDGGGEVVKNNFLLKNFFSSHCATQVRRIFQEI